MIRDKSPRVTKNVKNQVQRGLGQVRGKKLSSDTIMGRVFRGAIFRVRDMALPGRFSFYFRALGHYSIKSWDFPYIS